MIYENRMLVRLTSGQAGRHHVALSTQGSQFYNQRKRGEGEKILFVFLFFVFLE